MHPDETCFEWAIEPEESGHVVNDNPIFSDEARKLVAEWLPWGIEREKSLGSWGVGCDLSIFNRKEDEYPTLWMSSTKRRGMGTETRLPDNLNEIYAAGISLLVYAATEEMRRELDNG